MVKKLLLGYDGSETAQEAARVAALVAKQLDAKVIVLTVGQLVSAVGTVVVPTVDENAFLPTAEDGAGIVRTFGVDAESEVLFGGPAQMIVDISAREGCDIGDRRPLRAWWHQGPAAWQRRQEGGDRRALLYTDRAREGPGND